MEKEGLEKPKRGRPDKSERLARDIEKLLEINRDIASQQSPNSVDYNPDSGNPIHKELVKLYNFLAQFHGYKTIDHMIAVAHATIIAEAIASPATFGVQAIKAIEQAQKNVRPPDDKAVPGKLPQGESKRDILKRLEDHFEYPTKGKPPS
jgi:hypothetical protein